MAGCTSSTHEVWGDGDQVCSGSGYTPTKVNISIQKRFALVTWQTLSTWSSGWENEADIYGEAAEKCQSGTITYRIVTTGYAEGGNAEGQDKSLNYLQVKC